MGGGVFNVRLGHVFSDGLQDLQDAGAVGALSEQGQGEVAGHDKKGLGFGAESLGRCRSHCIRSGRQVSRGAAGDVEGNHPLCLLQGGEPLRIPGVAVGALVADLIAGQGHGSGCLVACEL